MKIIEVIPSLDHRGGAEVFFVSLCDELFNDKTNELFVICLYDTIDPSFLWFIEKHKERVFFCHKKTGLDVAASIRFRQKVISVHPDVINMHLSCLPTYFLGFCTRHKNWKIYYTTHTVAQHEFCGWRKMIVRLYQKKKWFTFIGISNEVSKTIASEFPRAKIRTIFNGAKFPIEKSAKDNPQFDLICVARFSKEKNHKLLFDSLKAISKSKRLSLICVGDGALLQESKNYVKEIGIESQISFVGGQSNVFIYLKNASIFVLSSFYEGNPISIIEAYSAGLPIIAPKVGGIPDVVEDGVNGLLFDVNSVDSLSSAILKLSDSANLRETFACRNREKALLFTIARCANQYKNVFAEGIVKK